MIRLPFGIGRNEIWFSLKAFAASVLALWIALSLDLQKPYWAMATAYIVIQPLAAAVTSKAVFRVAGTVLGAAAAVVLVPNLVGAPELLCLALAGWVGLCLFFSLLDRTPRSYVAMLAGYSAAIIAFTSVNAPDQIFDIALSRTEEITIGIICAALLSRLVAPRHLGPLLTGRLDGWLADAGRWAGDVLSGRPEPKTSLADRRRLATDTVEMLALTTHLPYDTSELRYVTRRVQDLQQHMTALLPLLSGLEDRLSALRSAGALDPPVALLVDDVARWIEGTERAVAGRPEELRQRAEDLAATLQAPGSAAWSWPALLTATLLERLRQLVDVWANSLALRAHISDPRHRRTPLRPIAARPKGEARLHVDVPMAALAGLSVGIATLASCAFWIVTGWHDGSGAAQMTAIFFSLFAAMDNPLPVMRLFGRYTLYAILAVGLFQFAILPFADGFLELVLVMAPFLLVFGALMATPRYGPLGFLMCVNMPLVTLLDARLHLSFTTFINTNTASMLGIFIATMTAALLTAMGAERSIARLLRANRIDLAHIAMWHGGRDTAALVRRLVDRFGLLTQRLMALPAAHAPAPERVLVDLRIGLNIAALQRARLQLPVAARQAIEALLARLADRFRDRARMEDAPPLAGAIDDALALVVDRHHTSPAARSAMNALIGLRHALAPSAAAPIIVPALTSGWSLPS